MQDNQAALWSKCLQAIQTKVQPQSFQTWFGPIASKYLGPDKAVIEVPSAFFAEWIEEHYADVIREALEEETSWRPTLEFIVRGARQSGPVDFSASRPGIATARQTEIPLVNLNPRFRFKRFVPEKDTLSFAAAKAVARRPGKTPYNPLFIYGATGLGKTHLLQAIGRSCLRKGTASNVVYVTAERFVSGYISCIQKRDTSEFAKQYRSPDLLLVDDIQFFSRRKGSQREFLHTFDALYQSEKQIVLTADRAPDSLKGFSESLVSRFQLGLVCEIEAPNLDMRIAILRKKASERRIDLRAEVAVVLAGQASATIRKLEGDLTRLVALAERRNVPLSVDLAREILSVDRTREILVGKTDLEEILHVVAPVLHVSVDLLTGRSRRQEVVAARNVCMYLCNSLTAAPLKAIGDRFGGRDHSAVVRARQTIEKRRSQDPGFEKLLLKLVDLARQTLVAKKAPGSAPRKIFTRSTA